MVFLENEYLKINITLDGGSLTSIYDKKKNNELLSELTELANSRNV